MNRRTVLLAIVLVAVLGAAARPALADHARSQGGPRFEAPRDMQRFHAQRRMDRDERQRLREDLDSARRDVYRDRERSRDRERAREDWRERLSPEERERLRRDVQDANRDLERRRRR